MAFISREQALKLVESSSKRAHVIVTARIMKVLAKRLGKDEEEWELVGLLHDLDYDMVRDDMSKHGILAAEMLEGWLSQDAIYAIKAHDHRTGFKPRSTLDRALIASDSLATFIEDQAADAEVEALKVKLGEDSLPKPWLRDAILSFCEELELPLGEFLEIGLGSHRGREPDSQG